MACDLLSKGWSRDEVNARLGHAPSSREIDRYINYFALDRARPKQKLHEDHLKRLTTEITQMREREKLAVLRLHKLQQSSEAQIAHLQQTLEIHSQIAVLSIERQLGRMGVKPYLQSLRKLYALLTGDPQEEMMIRLS